jgi:Domain of unknown function (DUF4278)
MQLFYRGTTFNYDPAERAASRLAQRTVESPYELTYRGHTYQIDPTVTPETSVRILTKITCATLVLQIE